MNHLRIWNQRNEIDHHHRVVVGGTTSSSSLTTTTTTTSNESPINEPVTPVVLQSLDDMMIDTHTIETIPAVVLVDTDEIIYDTINTCKTSYYYYSIRSLFRNHRKYKLTDGLTKIPSSIKPDETISSTTTNNNDDDNIYDNMNHHTTLHGSFNTIPSSQDQTYNVVDTSFMGIEKNEEKCTTDLKKKSVNVTIETNNIHMNDDETNNTVLETPSPTNTDDEFDDYNNTNSGNGNDDSNRKRMNQKFFRRGRLV